MSHLKAVPLNQLSKYSADADQIVLLSSTNEQPGDAAEMVAALSLDLSAYATAADAQARRALIGLYTTAGTPSNSIGNNGDFAFDTTSPLRFWKTGGVWIQIALPFSYLDGATEGILTALGIPTYADITAANTALASGKPFYNTALAALDTTTA